MRSLRPPLPVHLHQCIAMAAGVACLLTPSLAGAQADVYNTDAGRPVRTEDAYAIDRYLLDLYLAPVSVASGQDRGERWRVEPGATLGLVPRTQLEVSLPVAYRDGTIGIAGLDVNALYNLNAETSSWPALGVRGGVLMSAGQFGPERAYPSLKAIATRTFDWARMHVNAGYTFGAAPLEDVGSDAAAPRRWVVGGAVDRSFPLRSLLLAAETYLEQPLDETSDVMWTVGAGLRYQFAPPWLIEAGIGGGLNGNARPLFLTFGIARSTSIKMLMPGMGRWGD